MKQASLILGIISILGMLIGLIPCLGWFNWLNLPLALIGLILGAIDYNDEQKMITPMRYDDGMVRRGNNLPLGLILCAIALVIGMLRLFIGGGVL
jgi:hypothetical protein